MNYFYKVLLRRKGVKPMTDNDQTQKDFEDQPENSGQKGGQSQYRPEDAGKTEEREEDMVDIES